MTDPTEAEMDALVAVLRQWRSDTLFGLAGSAILALRAQVAALEAERVMRVERAYHEGWSDGNDAGGHPHEVRGSGEDWLCSNARAALAPQPAPTDEIAAAAGVLRRHCKIDPGDSAEEIVAEIARALAKEDGK